MTVDIAALAGKDWWGSLVAAYNHGVSGSSTVVQASPTVTVVVDAQGHHTLSGSAGNPTKATVTSNQGATSVSFGASSTNIQFSSPSMPNVFSWELKVDSSGRIWLVITETVGDVTTETPILLGEVRPEGNGTPPSSGIPPGSGDATRSFILILQIQNVPPGRVIIGTPEVIGEGETPNTPGTQA